MYLNPHFALFPVELDGNPPADTTRVQYDTVLTEVAATASSMSPDTNGSELTADRVHPHRDTPRHRHRHPLARMNGAHREAAVPEELPDGAAAVASAGKTPVGREDEERIREYMRRRDTAVVYPEAFEGGEWGASGGWMAGATRMLELGSKS